MEKVLKGWTRVASGTAGEHGMPGTGYHRVDGWVSRRGKSWRCAIIEHWGSHQGYLEEHDCREVCASGQTGDEAIRFAARRAEAAEMRQGYLVQLVSQLEDELLQAQAGDDA
jgi:hypothetical protein